MKKIKVVGINVYGMATFHVPAAGPGDHDTLCGIDADDPKIGHYNYIDVPNNQKVTCRTCKTIWFDIVALKLRKSDFVDDFQV